MVAPSSFLERAPLCIRARHRWFLRGAHLCILGDLKYLSLHRANTERCDRAQMGSVGLRAKHRFKREFWAHDHSRFLICWGWC